MQDNATSTKGLLSHEEYEEKIKGLKTMKDVSNFVKELVAPTLQTMLEAELSAHLGYDKHARTGPQKTNVRNGYSEKTLKGNFGQATLKVPRDREGTYEPVAVKKYETVESDVEERIISMYAKGMTTRDIQDHMQEIYGVSVSPAMVSMITDKVMPLVAEWQNRPLASLYPVLFLDGIHFKVRESGKIVNKCGYTVLGITADGCKEILGIWIGATEGAKFWMQVLNDLKNRGVDDILIACTDDLSGFSEAIKAVFPKTDIQKCVVHQIRNTIKFVAHKHKDKFCQDLRTIYNAPTEEAGLAALEEVRTKWPDYAFALESWNTKWAELSPFFAYSPIVRKFIYTTNAIENVHRQLRKVTKTTTIFPSDEALTKLLWLAIRDITKKWTQTLPGWSEVMRQFAIAFPDRIKLT